MLSELLLKSVTQYHSKMMNDKAIVRLQRKYSYILGLSTTSFRVFFNICSNLLCLFGDCPAWLLVLNKVLHQF